MQNSELQKNIDKLKADFYAKQSKNFFFTSKQKLAVAESVSKAMNLEEWVQMSVYIIGNTNKVYIDYSVLKSFANPTNYKYIVDYVLSLITACIKKDDTFEMHVNLDSFTVSACHRYKEAIELYLTECMKMDTEFSEKLNKMYLYNIPSVFETIQKMLAPLMHEAVKRKIDLYNKKESVSILQQLLIV